MEPTASDKCLERLGTSLNALSRYGKRLRDSTAEAEVSVVFYDDNNRPRRDKVSLGAFVEYVDEETSSLRVGLVVGCLLSRMVLGAQPQDVVLIVELPAENGETAKMPPPDSVCRIVPTTGITCKIDVEQRAPPPPAKMLAEDAAFVLAVNSSFYGLDQDGTHTIGAYVTNLVSLARSRRGEMYATTDNCRILSVELEKGRVKELASTRVFDSTRKQHHETEFSGNPIVQIRGLCFAEGRPAAFDPRIAAGASQLYGIGKDVPNRGGDCVCTVNPSGRCDVVFELGRKDVVALAVVPIRLSANESPNVWSRIGPNDADPKAMRFIIWTEKGGLFVVDETRRCLQQLGGDLVRSLEISAIAFDPVGELYAAGSQSLFTVSPTGRVIDVAPLIHLPGKVYGVCHAPRAIAHPGLYGDDEFIEEPAKEEKSSPTRTRSKSWWILSRGPSSSNAARAVPSIGNQPANASNDSTGGLSGLLRLLRLKPKSTPAADPAPTNKPRPGSAIPDYQRQPRPPQQQQVTFQPSGGSFSGRRVSNPLLPMEGTSMGETNRRGSGTLTRAPFDENYQQQQSLPRSSAAPYGASPSRRAPQQQQPRGPYYPSQGDDDEYEDDDMVVTTKDEASMVASIRPPPNPPPPSTATAASQQPIPAPPSSAPPSTTARAVPMGVSVGSSKYKDVPAMLHALGLAQYVADFRREDLVDMDLLSSMWKNERDFKDMLKDVGVGKLGHREMIAHAIRQYQQETS